MADKDYENIGFIRVSGLKQGLYGDSPDEQKELVVKKAASMGERVDRWFEFIQSASGVIQPSQEALEYCKTHKVKYAFVKSMDRATRAGGIVFLQLKAQLIVYGTMLIDTFGEISYQKINTMEPYGLQYPWSTFYPGDRNEYLKAEEDKSEVRKILTRMISAEVRYLSLGYWPRGAPPGFKAERLDTPHGRRQILVPHDTEALWYIRIFELRADLTKSDDEIVEAVNKMSFLTRRKAIRDKKDRRIVIGHSGENPLTVKLLQDIVKRPIFAGVICETWTHWQPIKANFKGLVQIDLWNRANRGKRTIVEENGEIKIHEGPITPWAGKRKKDNPEYAYKEQVLCPICRSPLLGSAPRNKSGNHIGRYHCARGHAYWSINKKIFDKVVVEFIGNLHFSEEFRMKIREIITQEWEKRREEALSESRTMEESVHQLKVEKQSVLDKIKMLSSPIAVKAMEEELDKVDARLAQTEAARNVKEEQEIDIQTAINYVRYYMEHLQELLLGGPDPLKEAALFGLVFDQPPTYTELFSGTPKLAPLFNLNKEFETSKSDLARLTGIEPVFVVPKTTALSVELQAPHLYNFTMKLYVFRHGETTQSKFELNYGPAELTASILPEAVPVVERIGEYFKDVRTDANFVSQYLRCLQTTDIVSRVSGKKFIPNPLLNEYVAGQLDNLRDRANMFLKHLADKNFSSVAVCTHGAVVAALKHLAISKKFAMKDLYDYPKCGLVWTVENNEVIESNFRLGSSTRDNPHLF